MKNCLIMLVEVNVASAEEYEAQFEKKFLEDSRTFYQRECQEFMAQNTCPEYMRKVEARLRQEETRAAQYLFKVKTTKVTVESLILLCPHVLNMMSVAGDQTKTDVSGP